MLDANAGNVMTLAASVGLPRLGLAIQAVVGVLTAEGINAADDAAADDAESTTDQDAAPDGTMLRDCEAERKRSLFAADPVRRSTPSCVPVCQSVFFCACT